MKEYFNRVIVVFGATLLGLYLGLIWQDSLPLGIAIFGGILLFAIVVRILIAVYDAGKRDGGK